MNGIGPLICAALFVLAACDAPSPGARIVVQNEPVVVAADPEPPEAVLATVEQLKQIARDGSPWDMARLARATPGFRSNGGEMEHGEYWYLKYRSGDWPMAHLGKVLAYRPAIEERADGQVYVWPYMALARPYEMTPKTLRDMEDLLGREAAERVAAGGSWPGYRLGVAEDGSWLYFYTGAD